MKFPKYEMDLGADYWTFPAAYLLRQYSRD
jgi:hypothetical protein